MWIFVACLVLGVLLVAAGGGLYQQVANGLSRDARLMFGGDVEVEATAPLPAEALRWAAERGEVSRVALQPEGNLADTLAERDGRWGAALDASLAQRFGLAFVFATVVVLWVLDAVTRGLRRLVACWQHQLAGRAAFAPVARFVVGIRGVGGGHRWLCLGCGQRLGQRLVGLALGHEPLELVLEWRTHGHRGQRREFGFGCALPARAHAAEPRDVVAIRWIK